MKGNALVYLVAAIIGLVVLQAAVGLFFSFLPTILFFVATLIAGLCTYAIYTEKDGRRIVSVDRLLGIVAVAKAKPESATTASRATPRVPSMTIPADEENAPVNSTPTTPMEAVDFHIEGHTVSVEATSGSRDPVVDVSSSPAAAAAPATSPGTAVPSSGLPRPPGGRVNYGDLIDDIKSKPIPKPVPPPPRVSSNGQTSVTPSTPKGIDYGNLVARVNLAAPSVMSKDDLMAAIARNVIGQRAAIETLATYVRGKIGSRDTGKNKPLVFLLPGPTGTGKTEISKALAEALGTKLVRYDMGEFAEEHKASNLFGSPKGYIGSEDGGALPNAIRRGGKRLVVLFDEVEKAHKSLWQQMLAFMDEGRTGDSKGEVVAPKDTIILLTTNRQAEAVAKDPAAAREILRHDGYFSPEFMGRIEKVVPMPRLTDADMMQLTHRLADALARTYGLSLAIDEDALILLYSESREGAERSGGRGITERLKDLLIEDLLDLQGTGAEIVRLMVEHGRVRAVPA